VLDKKGGMPVSTIKTGLHPGLSTFGGVFPALLF
jgi:hypothetical protein